MAALRAKHLPLKEPNPREVARRHLCILPPPLEAEFDVERWVSDALDDEGEGKVPAQGAA